MLKLVVKARPVHVLERVEPFAVPYDRSMASNALRFAHAAIISRADRVIS